MLKEIATKNRRIVSEIPHPKTKPVIRELEKIEPKSMAGFPPVVWNLARGYTVEDAFGNKWIDFTSSAALANAGHSHPKIAAAIKEQVDRQLWHNYCNPSDIRLKLVKKIREIVPPYLNKIFLLTTGSEATECAIKLMRMYGRSKNKDKYRIISYKNSFHGRTMGSQMAGGFINQQEWMGKKPEGFYHIPYPDCAECPWGKKEYRDCGKECFHNGIKQLKQQRVKVETIAGVITETFPGPRVAFMPEDYVRALGDWTKQNDILLVFDEIQAGFGRTGKWFGFEHYAVKPDMIALGKGMTSSLPMSAVAGRGKILDLARQGEMSSTHTGNPLCSAAAIANIEVIKDERMIENARKLETVVRKELHKLKDKYPGYIGAINGKGLVWAVYMQNPHTGRLDIELAKKVTTLCMQRGLLMLQTHRGTLKMLPPLCITVEALREGIGVIDGAIEDILKKKEGGRKKASVSSKA